MQLFLIVMSYSFVWVITGGVITALVIRLDGKLKDSDMIMVGLGSALGPLAVIVWLLRYIIQVKQWSLSEWINRNTEFMDRRAKK